jgi:TPR repeat protein
MYLRGEGQVVNEEQAVHWFTQAAEQGDALAQYHLGLCYYEGTGVTKDLQEAYVWLALASAQRVPNAHDILDTIETELSAKQIADAQSRAQAWQPALH